MKRQNENEIEYLTEGSIESCTLGCVGDSKMILLQSNKKGESQGNNCHDRTMIPYETEYVF
jgi:hypothetical protein